jgi:hypothetical protein
MNLRILGTLGMLGGAGLLGVELRHLISGVELKGATIDALDEGGYLLWGIGGACAFWAAYRLGVTGTGKWTRLVPFVTMLGFAAMAVGSAMDILRLASPMSNPLVGPAWLLILIGTLLAGIFALIARTWVGWRKFAPILCILVVPAFILLGALTGGVANLLFGAAWVVLGYAVFSSDAAAAQGAPVVA